MKLFVNMEKYHQEVHHLLEEFFPEEVICSGDLSESDCVVMIHPDSGNITLKLGENAFTKDFVFVEEEEIFSNSERNTVKMTLYGILQEIKPTNLPWGAFTGVHPTKITRRLRKLGYSSELLSNYGVSGENISLLNSVCDLQERLLSDKLNGLSLYVNIPFCPTRCAYCSFPTKAAKENDLFLFEYVEMLREEVSELSKFIPSDLDTVYVGGGTPTVLSCKLLESFMKSLRENFNLSALREFTVEAGRPDTITDEKLRILAENGVDRISINPQTMCDETLKAISRKHTSKDIERAFETVRRYKFKTINADIILGLEGEGEFEMKKTLSRVKELSPENITVHTLSMKRGARYMEEHTVRNSDSVKNMVYDARIFLEENGFSPYYLYRQKNMIGSLENIGYSKKGHEGLYNILMMDELSPILSIGMGAISKFFHGDKITRIADFREWNVYTERREEKLLQKIEELKMMGGCYNV